MTPRHVAAAMVALVVCPPVSVSLVSAAPDTVDSELPHLERLGSEHGLSHNSVYAIMQDRRGFLWFGTQDGLNRYDGRTFVVHKHDPDDAASLASSLVTALLEDREGRLWIGTAAGLDVMSPDGRRFEHFPLQPTATGSPARPDRVEGLLETPTGEIWVATWNGLFQIDRTRARVVAYHHDSSDAASLAANMVSAIDLHPDGTVWALSVGADRDATLHRIGPRIERFPLPFTWTFRIESRDRIWVDRLGPRPIASLGGLDHRVRYRGPPTAFARDRTGRMWIGTHQGLHVLSPGSSTARAVPTTPSGERGLTDEVHAIVEDRAGGIWIGTYGGVLRHDVNRKSFRHIGHTPGAPGTLGSSAVSSVRQDDEGMVWIGTYGAGLDQLDLATGRLTHHRHRPDDPASLGHDYVWSLALSRHHRLWVGVSPGLFSLEADGRFERHPLPDGFAPPRVMEEGPDGTLWIGGFPGLYAYDPSTGAGRIVGSDSDFAVISIDTVRVAPDGTIWFASAASGDIGHYDPASDTGIAYRALVEEGIWDTAETPDGTLWLATGGGLVRFDTATGSAERLRPEAGEMGSVYYSVEVDDDGRLWLGTNKGLVRLEPGADLDRFKRYDRSDGIGSTEFNRHAAFKGSGGELFFGGMNGLTMFRPSDLRDNPYVPPVALTDIEILSRRGVRDVAPPLVEELTLEPDDYAVAFEFAALSFTESAQNRYAYMLDGFDDGWIDNGTISAVRYTSLPPGRYVFRARGSNNDGVWNEEGVSLAVTVLPPYWQTWWFRVAAVGLVVALLTVAYRVRVRRLLQLERMRLQIAGDLHDELGSELSGIALASAMLGRKAHLTDQDRDRLAGVESTALRVMQGLRDIVWYINPEHDTLRSMEQRMRTVARQLLEGIPTEFRATLSATAAISMDKRREIFLIYRELLHNVARHAGASRVDIRLEATDSRLHLVVADDGTGFDGDGERTDGTGLRSIRRRAAGIGGRLTIDTRPGRGTRVSLLVDVAA